MTDGSSSRAPGDDRRVDELRQQLRALGYLEAGVDRFVLGPARETRSPLAIAALAALRVGVIAGALLGPAVALGIGARLPALVTGTRDAFVVALYLALAFGAAAGAATFVVSLVVARLPVRAFAPNVRGVSRAAGTLVGAACLAYLTLWWRITNLDVAAAGPLWTAFVLAVAVAISLLLGHTAAITVFAVHVAARGRVAPNERDVRSPWRLTIGAAAVAFAGAASLLLLAGPGVSREDARPALPVVSPGLRVKVLAIDGFDPEIARSLMAADRMPTLSRTLSAGSARIPSEDSRDPARVWTTVATGQPAEIHGVRGLETRRLAGVEGAVASGETAGLGRALRGATDLLRLTRPSTASGTELRSKTFWEVAADAGLRAAVVNWWATWPASAAGPNAPIVVSDRATLRLEHGGALDAEIAPQTLYERLRTDWPGIRQAASRTVADALPEIADPEIGAVLLRAAGIDALQLAVASRLDLASLDLLAIHLPGLDIVQHTLLASGAGAASELAARLDAVRAYYVYLDRLLRDVAVPAADELIVLVTQPGRMSPVTHGVLAVVGRGIDVRGDVEARATDVAPTILHALGVPLSRELEGRPVLQLFSEEFVERFPVREVETYGRRALPAGGRRGQPLDQEMIERLRSLGYVR